MRDSDSDSVTVTGSGVGTASATRVTQVRSERARTPSAESAEGEQRTPNPPGANLGGHLSGERERGAPVSVSVWGQRSAGRPREPKTSGGRASGTRHDAAGPGETEWGSGSIQWRRAADLGGSVSVPVPICTLSDIVKMHTL